MDDEIAQQHDDDDDDVEARETDSVGNLAPWTPNPLGRWRAFVRRHPDAAISVDFPVVYEEDRAKMITDLASAQERGVITHQQMSERVAKELGIEQYDYKTEQARIAQEDPALPRMPSSEPALGNGDDLARAFGDDEDDLDDRGKRDELSGENTRRFRRQQRQSESAPSLLFKEVERDSEGRAVRVIEAYAGEGGVKVSRVVRDEQGRIVGLEPVPEHAEREPEPEE